VGVFSDIKSSIYFIDFFTNTLDTKVFEQWVYANKQIANDIPDSIYTDLICIDFSSKDVHCEINKLVEPFIDYAGVHKAEILPVSFCG